MLKIHETIDADGGLSPLFLRCDEGELAIVGAEGTLRLPGGALEAVMARFGAPLEPTARLTPVATLALGEGDQLCHVRHLARFDVIARDYVVYERSGRESLCALATSVAGALEHLGRAARAATPGGEP